MNSVSPSAAPHTASHRFAVGICWLQGLYYSVTGIWPLVSIETFQWVTGRKTDHLVTGRESDHWLVNTVAVLILAIAVTLLVAAWRRHVTVEVAVLAMASAIALAAIDVVYVARGTILPIYLADAVAEVILIAAWAFALPRSDLTRREAVSDAASKNFLV